MRRAPAPEPPAAGRRWPGDREALDDAARARPALVAVQPVNNETGVIQPLEEIAGAGARGGRAVAGRLRAVCRQIAVARCRFYRRIGAQARRAAGDRRAAGPRHRDAQPKRRAGAGLSRRHRESARRARLRRRARGRAWLDRARRCCASARCWPIDRAAAASSSRDGARASPTIGAIACPVSRRPPS